MGVFPSVCEETYGMVALEFLRAEIPVIASRIGWIPEYLRDGENGLLVPGRQPCGPVVHFGRAGRLSLPDCGDEPELSARGTV